MPFQHSEELHHKILYQPEFESDEEYFPESDELNKINAEQLSKQNRVLTALSKTIKRVKNAIQPDGKIDFEMSEVLRKGVQQKCGQIDGLKPDYVETNDIDSDQQETLDQASKQQRLQ